MDTLSVGLSDIGNAVGNPRAAFTPQGVEMAKQRLQASQVDQLQRRHAMWDDAHKQSMALPTEIMTDPRFSGLAQAKAALDKDLMDGKVDNEKNVSNFLTELLRSKKDLEDLQLQTGTEHQLEQEKKLSQGRLAQQEAEYADIKARAEAGDPVAQASFSRMAQPFEHDGQTAWMTPAEQLKFRTEDERWDTEQKFREKQLEEQMNLRRAQQVDTDAYRRAMLGDRVSARNAALTRGLYDKAMRRRLTLDRRGNPTNDPQIAEIQALQDITPMLFSMAESSGIRIERVPQQGGFAMPGLYPSSQGGGGIKINGQLVENELEAARILFGMLGS
jgi:hypothetical protein